MGASFKDDEGREWHLRLNHTLVAEIRDALGVNLHHVDEQAKALQRMADEPELLVNVLYLVCEKQCQRLKIGEEDFGRGFGGDTYENAALAFREAVVLFTPPPRRDVAKFAMTMTQGAMEAATETVKQILQKTMDDAKASLATSGR